MEIKRLTTKKGKFTQAEKEYLITEGAKVGIEPPTNTACPDCWRDMAIRICIATAPKPEGVRLRGMAARNGVRFKGRIITNPLDADTLAWMEANGFPSQLLEGGQDAEG
mgnify:CR=1 FL=1